MSFLSKIKNFVGYHLYFAYKFTRDRSNKELYKHYNQSILKFDTEETKTLIVMIDGRMKHGGIADRLRGIVSIYHYAKKKGYNFKIYHSSPFSLKNYLKPNRINWEIEEQELIYDIRYSKPIFLESLGILGEHWTQERILNINTNDNRKQYHIYTNIDLYPKFFEEDFNCLFKPSLPLVNELEKHLSLIGESFITVTLRFQQLLGDFIEGDYPILNDVDRKKLIDKCIQKVIAIQKTYAIESKILVTSDSSLFLEAVDVLPYVYVIQGKVVHIDYTTGSLFDVYLKSFVDMLMISKAQQSFLLVTGGMYKSGFAQRAAMIGNVRYKEIEF
jgi:hypothetical protein